MLDDVRFILRDVLGETETYDDVLAGAAELCRDVIAPLNAPGDLEGAVWRDGAVTTPDGFKEAFRAFADGGWIGLTADPEHGGSGLPHLVGAVLEELLCAANLSFSTYAGLTSSAYRAVALHGDAEQRARLLPPLAQGTSTGTMCLTEGHAGTDLGLIRTGAEPDGAGSYRISGQKIFITAGEHDLTDDILHLVLARLPDAPAGVRGISLFAVPRRLDDGTRNAVECISIEHKMGIRASATCTLAFDGAVGELIGEPHRGMRAMFTMMNAARLGVGIQGLALAQAAYVRAAEYARERLQGRALGGAARPDLEADPIIVHPDVRRTLLRIRSQVEGGRALALWVAAEIDRAEGGDAAAEDLVALMTPIVKAGLTDLGSEAANLALGVFGGHGYIRENGMEQLVRDARITSIYEGTNGVQALDLVGRKLPEGAGRLLRRFFHPSLALLDEACADERLADIAGPARDALHRLRRVTLWVATRGHADREEAGAAASDYLRLFYLTALGVLWVRMARAALDRDDEFGRAKLATARFYAARMLPETSALARQVTAGKATLMELPAERF
jgi:alkylation response protein AidB-like acyl-CoA dehydrogenase